MKKTLLKIIVGIIGVGLMTISNFNIYVPAFAARTRTSEVVNSRASTNDFYFNTAEFNYYLSKDENGVSKMAVTEILVAEFPNYDQNHGITRIIPFTNQDGTNLTTASSRNLSIGVTRNGEPEKVSKIEVEDRAFVVYIGDENTYVQGEQVYELRYEFENVITEFEGYQELYWDTNGTGWSQPFYSLTANLHVGEGITAPKAETTWCYVGRSGSNDQSRCEISAIDDGVSFSAENLRAGENLTMATQFPSGSFVIENRESMILVYVGIGVGAISLLVLLYVAHAYRKHAKGNRKFVKGLPTPAQYIPQEGLEAAEVAKLYLKGGRSPEVATLLELAVDGKVELVQTAKKKWTIRVKTVSGLSDVQSTTLQFFAGEMVNLMPGVEIPIRKHSGFSSTRSTLKANLPLQLTGSLVRKDMFAAKPKTGGAGAITALYIGILVVGGVGLGIYLSQSYETLLYAQYLWPAIGGVAGVTIIIAFTLSALTEKYAKYTERGLEASNYAAGLREYIALAEKDRLEFNQSTEGAPKMTENKEGVVRLYERLLPYACIFGLEKSWMKQLQVYYDENPDFVPAWYVGTTMFNMHDFNSAMDAMHSSIASMSASSSSSGNGGGGFSGGGGGGGGGGGW